MIRFFVAREYKVSPKKILKWGGAFYRAAEQSIMLNPSPAIQATANGFALMGAMNQDKDSREKHGSVQDYHILPQLFTFERRVAIEEIEKEYEEKKLERATVENSGYMRMLSGMNP